MKFVFLTIFSILFIFPVSAQTGGDHLCSISKRKNFFVQNTQRTDYPGDSTIDVTYYKLDLKITTSPDFLIGEVTVRANSLKSSLSSFFLDFEDNMIVDTVLSGNVLLSFSQADDKLNITLNNPASVGDNFEVVIRYHGVPKTVGFGS